MKKTYFFLSFSIKKVFKYFFQHGNGVQKYFGASSHPFHAVTFSSTVNGTGTFFTLEDQIVTSFWIICKLNMIAMQENLFPDI